jgi:hypothetical protein
MVKGKKLNIMNINEFISSIALLKPSRDEIIDSFEGNVDLEYVDYILNSFTVSIRGDCQDKNLIEQIIDCTNASIVDFGGISFNYKLESIYIDNTAYLKFASFQENILAVSTDFRSFIFADIYNPNREPIICSAPLYPEKFISAILFLLKLDVEFKYKKTPVIESEILKLSEISGDEKYAVFFKALYSQFI